MRNMFEGAPGEGSEVSSNSAESQEVLEATNKEQAEIAVAAEQLLNQVKDLDSLELPSSKIEEIKERVNDIVAGHLGGIRAIGYLSSLGGAGFSALEVASKGVSSAESATLGLLVGAGGIAATEAFRALFKWFDKLGLEKGLLEAETTKQ